MHREANNNGGDSAAIQEREIQKIKLVQPSTHCNDERVHERELVEKCTDEPPKMCVPEPDNNNHVIQKNICTDMAANTVDISCQTIETVDVSCQTENQHLGICTVEGRCIQLMSYSLQRC